MDQIVRGVPNLHIGIATIYYHVKVRDNLSGTATLVKTREELVIKWGQLEKEAPKRKAVIGVSLSESSDPAFESRTRDNEAEGSSSAAPDPSLAPSRVGSDSGAMRPGSCRPDQEEGDEAKTAELCDNMFIQLSREREEPFPEEPGEAAAARPPQDDPETG